MKQILDYLEQLDFSKVESELYISLLDSGPMGVAELAERVKINRTATYAYIASLLKKGVVVKIKGKSNKIAANSPENLNYLVEQKLSTAKKLKEKLPPIISALNISFPRLRANSDSEMKYYKGRNGVKAIYEECLKAKELRSYYNASDIINIFPENFQLFNDSFKHNPEIKMYEICEDSPQARRQIKFAYGKENKRYFWKLLPEDVKVTSNDILIYEGKVSIINIRDESSVEGVVLSNRDYYNNSRQLFDLLWRFLPEPK